MTEISDVKKLLKNNTYPGRGLIVGKTKDCAVIAYFIMGRSKNSRNRILSIKNDDLYTEPFDESLVEDPSLIIYRALTGVNDKMIISNGDQTDTIKEYIENGKSFSDALSSRTYEPDAPNYTPRISAILTPYMSDFSYTISILKKDDKSDECIREFYEYQSEDNTGHLIHTYKSDGSPIPSFEGKPKEIFIDDDIDIFSESLWESLDYDNKISLFVRYINTDTKEITDKIFNKNEVKL